MARSYASPDTSALANNAASYPAPHELIVKVHFWLAGKVQPVHKATPPVNAEVFAASPPYCLVTAPPHKLPKFAPIVQLPLRATGEPEDPELKLSEGVQGPPPPTPAF